MSVAGASSGGSKRKAEVLEADESKRDLPVMTREAWLAARKALLAKEKEFSKLKDSLAAARRDLGMYPVKEDYVFQTTTGSIKLSDLFGSKDQLIVVHFMFPADWERGCSSCSLWADGYSSSLPHINRKAAFVAVAAAPAAKIDSFRESKGWTFPFVSSAGTTFNRDFGVEFTKEEVAEGHTLFNYGRGFPVSQGPGYSIFFKQDGAVYHTYSTYARGMELMCNVWGFFDMLPRGRDEKRNMDWLKHKEEYDTDA